ncbi:LysR family transcriptional regulator [Lysinibacillus sphaericus]|uniref:LysR family transcriptional regulator n=1 Tax=Lysinibacillus sphaericus TaxID=1421 RepID=UPI0018CFC670|nr:LysR family transcriptional regulator [Lysinibacillus sphaericus]MBG9455431.1 LysR family transcriptional regulator [Lysinibacillus sphaericus]MBG9478486.1 LysR family transcriptional regulator [Lysinibacillus sphaericus]MBG9594750.1 LysR family transcriptional regulator [Lysinibacillus sphaericus]
MDIKQLQTFLTASETLSFTQTAQLLDYAQSSITAQIKSLEEELGAVLFERLGKRITLTEEGHRLQQYAQKMLDLNVEMKKAVLNEQTQAVLKIGAQESQCVYRLPSVLQQFQKSHPQVKIIFKPVHTTEIAKDLLQSGNLDIAFITDAYKETPMLHRERLIQEQLVFVSAPTDSNEERAVFSLQQLSNETILLTESGCSYRNQLEVQLQQEGSLPIQMIEFASIEAIKQCVMAGLGITFLPKMVVEKELKNQRLQELITSTKLADIFTDIAWHKDKHISPYLADFIEIAMNMYKKF